MCLPPSPYSGRAYNSLALQLIDAGCVVAVDYPVFEGQARPSIYDYAQVVQAVMAQLGAHKSISLVGFHTGCLVAIEASLLSGVKPDQIILIDVPYFTEEKRKELQSLGLGYFPLSENLSDLQSAWDLSVGRQIGKTSLGRCFEMFVDHISAGTSAGDPFAAAFSYDCDSQFAKVSTLCFVIATKAGLYNESLRAAEVIANSVLVEASKIEVSVLEQSAKTTADLIRKCVKP